MSNKEIKELHQSLATVLAWIEVHSDMHGDIKKLTASVAELKGKVTVYAVVFSALVSSTIGLVTFLIGRHM